MEPWTLFHQEMRAQREAEVAYLATPQVELPSGLLSDRDFAAQRTQCESPRGFPDIHVDRVTIHRSKFYTPHGARTNHPR